MTGPRSQAHDQNWEQVAGRMASCGNTVFIATFSSYLISSVFRCTWPTWAHKDVPSGPQVAKSA